MGKSSNDIQEQCHNLREENQLLKQQSQEQEQKIKRLTSKFAWLLKDFKRDDPSLNVSTLELRQRLAETDNDLVKLRQSYGQLQNRLRIVQQQATNANKRPKINRSYSWVNPRVNSGMGRGKRRPNSTSQTLYTRYDQSPPRSAWTSQSPLNSPPHLQSEHIVAKSTETLSISSPMKPNAVLSDKLMNMLEEAQIENRRLHETITSLREKAVTYERAIENFQIKMREREAEFQEELFHARTTQIAETRQTTIENIEIQRLKRDVRQKTSYSHELELQLKDLRQRVEVYEKTVDQLTSENDLLVTKLSAEEKKSMTLKLQSDQCSSLQNRVRELNGTIRELMDEVMVLKETNNQLINNSRTKPVLNETEDQEVVKELRAKMGNLEKELQEEVRKGEDLLERLEEESKSKADSMSRVSELEVAIAIYEDTLKTKDMEIERMQQMIDVFDSQLDKNENSELQSQIAFMQSQIESKDFRIKELQEEIAHYQEVAHHYESQLKEKAEIVHEVSLLKELINREHLSERASTDHLVEDIKAELVPLLENLKAKAEEPPRDKLTIEQVVQTEPEKEFVRKVSRNSSPLSEKAVSKPAVTRRLTQDLSTPSSSNGVFVSAAPRESKGPIPKPRVFVSPENSPQKTSLKVLKKADSPKSFSDSDDDSDTSVESVKLVKKIEILGNQKMEVKKQRHKEKDLSSNAVSDLSNPASLNITPVKKAKIIPNIKNETNKEIQRMAAVRVQSINIQKGSTETQNSSRNTQSDESETESESLVDRKFISKNKSYSDETTSISERDSQSDASSIIHTPKKQPRIRKSSISESETSYTTTETESPKKNLGESTKVIEEPKKKVEGSPIKVRSDVDETVSESDTIKDSEDESFSSTAPSKSGQSSSTSRSRRRSSTARGRALMTPQKTVIVAADVHSCDSSGTLTDSGGSVVSTPKPKALQSQLGIRVNHLTLLKPLPDPRYGNIYVEAAYLDIPTSELETESVKFKTNSKLQLVFRSIVDVVGIRRKLFIESLKKNVPIRFTVVAEPKPEFDNAVDCMEIGYSTFSMIELLKQRNDVKDFNMDILDIKADSKIGIMNIGVYAFRLLSSLASEFQ